MGLKLRRQTVEKQADTPAAEKPRSRGGVTTPERPLVSFSESNEPVSLTQEEKQELLDWRRRVERLAEEDPEAYAEACRTGRAI